MPPKPKWSDTDEKGHIWIYNYVKSLPGYGTARKEDFMYKFSKNLLAIINRNPRWSDGSKQRAYFNVAKWLAIHHPDMKIIEEYRERGHRLKEEREEQEGENVLRRQGNREHETQDILLGGSQENRPHQN